MKRLFVMFMIALLACFAAATSSGSLSESASGSKSASASEDSSSGSGDGGERRYLRKGTDDNRGRYRTVKRCTKSGERCDRLDVSSMEGTTEAAGARNLESDALVIVIARAKTTTASLVLGSSTGLEEIGSLIGTVMDGSEPLITTLARLVATESTLTDVVVAMVRLVLIRQRLRELREVQISAAETEAGAIDGVTTAANMATSACMMETVLDTEESANTGISSSKPKPNLKSRCTPVLYIFGIIHRLMPSYLLRWLPL
ncbi:predicted protein [Thalassiosira pseudonana CCMP1335]|uniref:Uncharacterized protein n=1 Tax=Thalassiosira pseudonana TaxID=35128 RepID=B8CD11_THAPS|nr:predicted protein [Thalassiosira pseudonana CCMP1335]EED88526.1 predicted protein [Thalassiosira pseudonana CCMP1335]